MNIIHVGQVVEIQPNRFKLPKHTEVVVDMIDRNKQTFDMGLRDTRNGDLFHGEAYVGRDKVGRPLKELVEVYQPGKPNRVIWNHE